MFVSIDTDDWAHLCDLDNFRAFKVVVGPGVINRLVALSAIGRCDGNHVWVARQWIEQRGRRGDIAWQASFQGMVDYAASAGWIDHTGAIRAHVEHR